MSSDETGKVGWVLGVGWVIGLWFFSTKCFLLSVPTVITTLTSSQGTQTLTHSFKKDSASSLPSQRLKATVESLSHTLYNSALGEAAAAAAAPRLQWVSVQHCRIHT